MVLPFFYQIFPFYCKYICVVYTIVLSNDINTYRRSKVKLYNDLKNRETWEFTNYIVYIFNDIGWGPYEPEDKESKEKAEYVSHLAKESTTLQEFADALKLMAYDRDIIAEPAKVDFLEVARLLVEKLRNLSYRINTDLSQRTYLIIEKLNYDSTQV